MNECLVDQLKRKERRESNATPVILSFVLFFGKERERGHHMTTNGFLLTVIERVLYALTLDEHLFNEKLERKFGYDQKL